MSSPQSKSRRRERFGRYPSVISCGRAARTWKVEVAGADLNLGDVLLSQIEGEQCGTVTLATVA